MKRLFEPTKKLYGIDSKELANLSYVDALKKKLAYGNIRLEYLVSKLNSSDNSVLNNGLLETSYIEREIVKLKKALRLVEEELLDIES